MQRQPTNAHSFQINVLIHFLATFTYLEHHVFIIRETICTCNFYGMFFLRLFKQSSKWKNVHVLPPACPLNYTKLRTSWEEVRKESTNVLWNTKIYEFLKRSQQI
jgi:hypothetical protein